MITQLKNKIFQIRAATGIELFASPTGDYLANAVEINITKSRVIRSGEFHNKTIEELAEILPKANPIAVAVTGRAVILRKISEKEFTGNYFELLSPNSNPNEFYVFSHQESDSIWVCMIRKTMVDNIIERLISRGFKILHLSAGPFSIENVLPFINLESGDFIKTNFYSIELNDNRAFVKIEKNELPGIDRNDGIRYNPGRENNIEYNIGDQYIRQSAMIAFSVSMYLLRPNFTGVSDINPRITECKEDYFFQQSFMKTGVAFLITVMLSLIISFALFSHYFYLNQQLQVSEKLAKSRKMYDKKSEEMLAVESAFLQESGWQKASRVSFLADRIASMIPDNTVLTNMQIYPLRDPSLFETEGTFFRRDTILVSGYCDDPEDLSVFLNNLRNLNSISSVIVEDYSYRKDAAKGYFNLIMVAKR